MLKMADGVSKLEGWWKFLQFLLIIASGALLWDLGDRKNFFLSEEQQTFIYIVEGATLVLVLIQLIGILSKKLSPKLVAILLAIIGTIFWTAAAVIELRSYYYNFPKGIEEGLPGEIFTAVINSVTPELKEMKYKFLSLGIITAVNAFLLLVEACGVSSWRNSAAATQRGFVFQTV
ncbi:hypothetical protein J437_LFUL001236 [Ladona fulva]|uniref:Uncharacterized protein n=1 Tax=Ladona fulva TaxID=123851 RepID=A0A8K0JVW3_LADFU|nr:hypothetical protein J437_LFUL001236 [Ladona fulva]